MPDSHALDRTSNPTVAKLLAVDAELAVQEAELFSHLESVREKQRSLQTVINLFLDADTPAPAPPKEPAQTRPVETEKEPEPMSEDLAALPLETSRESATAEAEARVASDIQPNEDPKKGISSTRRNKTTRATPPQATKKTSEWQEYVREEFGKASLAAAVSSVLQRQADAAWEVSAIMGAIFVDKLPQEAGDIAHRRVRNILSEGVRKNEWYRGQLGQYSLSKAAVVS